MNKEIEKLLETPSYKIKKVSDEILTLLITRVYVNFETYIKVKCPIKEIKHYQMYDVSICTYIVSSIVYFENNDNVRIKPQNIKYLIEKYLENKKSIIGSMDIWNM